MNNTKLTCPPLTPSDVLTLRGNPMAKRIELLKNSFNPAMEEWIYYHSHTNTKESYKFKDGFLVGWSKEIA